MSGPHPPEYDDQGVKEALDAMHDRRLLRERELLVAATARIKELNSYIEQQQRLLDGFRGDAQTALEQLADSNRDNQLIKQNLAAAEAEIRRLTDAAATLKESAQETIRNHRQQSDEAVAQLKERISALHAAINKEYLDKRNLAERIHEAERREKEAVEKLGRVVDEVNKAITAKEDTERKLGRALDRIAELESEYHEAELAYAEVWDQAHAVYVTLTDRSYRLERLRRDHADLQSRLEAALRDAAAHQTEGRRHALTAADHAYRLDVARDRIARLEERQDAVRQQLASLQALVDDHAQRLESECVTRQAAEECAALLRRQAQSLELTLADRQYRRAHTDALSASASDAVVKRSTDTPLIATDEQGDALLSPSSQILEWESRLERERQRTATEAALNQDLQAQLDIERQRNQQVKALEQTIADGRLREQQLQADVQDLIQQLAVAREDLDVQQALFDEERQAVAERLQTWQPLMMQYDPDSLLRLSEERERLALEIVETKKGNQVLLGLLRPYMQDRLDLPLKQVWKDERRGLLDLIADNKQHLRDLREQMETLKTTASGAGAPGTASASPPPSATHAGDPRNAPAAAPVALSGMISHLERTIQNLELTLQRWRDAESGEDPASAARPPWDLDNH